MDDAQHDQFLRWYAEHEPALHTYIRSMLPHRQEASEVLQSVIVILWQKFDQAEDFKKWAFGVARLETLKYLQRRQRERLVFDEELVATLAEESLAGEQRLLDQREALKHCLEQLPAAQRQLVMAAYAKGVHLGQLAVSRGQTPMALYKSLQRIRAALLTCVRRRLQREGWS